MSKNDEQVERFDVVGAIMDYEDGSIDSVTFIDLFAHLIKSGTIRSLQGSYGRAAQELIDREYISEEGEVIRYFEDDE